MKKVLVTFLCFLFVLSAKSDERILIQARVNGKTVNLAFDTGSEYPILFENTVKTLGLNWTKPPVDAVISPSKVAVGVTEPFNFELDEYKTKCQFRVFKVPSYLSLGCDGVLPCSMFGRSIVYLNAYDREVSTLGMLPIDIDGWKRWELKADSLQVFFEVIKYNGETASVFVDTGADVGVELSNSLWESWKTQRQEDSTTLRASYYPSTGLNIYEVCWAKKLDIGNFSISDVPVSMSHHVYEATLGLYALSRLEVIFDLKNEVMYTKPIQKRPRDFPHNRIAAVFVPNDPSKDNDLIAHVVPSGIAHQAGIRDGDILLRIDDLDVTKWRTTPGILPFNRFWSKPHGTKLNLSLKREEKSYKVAVVLQDIFPLDKHHRVAETGRSERPLIIRYGPRAAP